MEGGRAVFFAIWDKLDVARFNVGRLSDPSDRPTDESPSMRCSTNV